MPSDDPIVVIGAGALGLALADQLTAASLPVTVVDQSPLAGFSSTRNQGWLQSGAYYAARESPNTAAACREGYERVQADCPEAIHDDIPCRFLFQAEDERDQAVALCAAQGIECTPMSDREMRQFHDESPLLHGSRLTFGAFTKDRPIDTHQYLKRVASRAAAQGASFRPVSCLHVVSIERQARGWRVSLGDGQTIMSRLVVVAAGAYIPHLLEPVAPELAAGFQATKVTVLSLSGTRDQFPSMLIAPYARRGTNLVPFRSSDGEGATICLAGDDELCDRRNALDADLPSGIRDRYERGFRRYLPGIEALARPSIPGHIYVCQKLTPLEVDGVAHNPRGELVAEIIEDLEEADGQRALVAAYPGKFTAAPIVADGIVTNLRQRFDPQVRVLYSADAPTIAKQRYFDANDIQLTAHDGAVEFEDLFPDA